MGPRLTVVVGLVAGLVVGAAFLVALVALLPTPPVTGASPSPTLAPSAGPSVTPAPPAPSSGAPPSAAPTPATSPGGEAFHIGEEAPPLRVAQLGGGEIDLAALRGKPVWVVFWATWCPSCRDEFPVMNGFAARHAEDGLVIVAVDMEEDEGAVASYVQELGLIFPVGLDPTGAAAAGWDVVAPPIHFFVDAEGVVRDGALGGIGPDIMAAALRRIMPGVDVEP